MDQRIERIAELMAELRELINQLDSPVYSVRIDNLAPLSRAYLNDDDLRRHFPSYALRRRPEVDHTYPYELVAIVSGQEFVGLLPAGAPEAVAALQTEQRAEATIGHA